MENSIKRNRIVNGQRKTSTTNIPGHDSDIAAKGIINECNFHFPSRVASHFLHFFPVFLLAISRTISHLCIRFRKKNYIQMHCKRFQNQKARHNDCEGYSHIDIEFWCWFHTYATKKMQFWWAKGNGVGWGLNFLSGV